MASLLDPLPDDVLRFLRITADGYAAAGGQWPCWQWVWQELWTRDDLDAEQILRGMPAWEYDYRPTRAGNRGQRVPKIADEVPLTIQGMAFVSPAVPAVQPLVDAFLTALGTALVMQRGIRPAPTRPTELKVSAADFTRAVNTSAGTELDPEQLFAILRGEPATWHGISQNGGEWTWDLTSARLAPYAGVRTVDDYLARLDAEVALPQQPDLPQYLPALALPEAFDHLGLAWRVGTGKRLFRVPRAALPAKLTLPAASAEDFESRCSALCDMLKTFDFSTEGGSLNNMKVRLGELLGDEEAIRARDAVDTLRMLFDLRAAQQHQGADTRAMRAQTALGLTRFGSDWAGAWDHLRATAVQSRLPTTPGPSCGSRFPWPGWNGRSPSAWGASASSTPCSADGSSSPKPSCTWPTAAGR